MDGTYGRLHGLLKLAEADQGDVKSLDLAQPDLHDESIRRRWNNTVTGPATILGEHDPSTAPTEEGSKAAITKLTAKN